MPTVIPVARTDVPPRVAFHTMRPPSSDSLRQTQSHGEFHPRVIRPRVRDAWEQRTLQIQLRQNASYRTSSHTGYSRGPELLKALAELKSRSHS